MALTVGIFDLSAAAVPDLGRDSGGNVLSGHGGADGVIQQLVQLPLRRAGGFQLSVLLRQGLTGLLLGRGFPAGTASQLGGGSGGKTRQNSVYILRCQIRLLQELVTGPDTHGKEGFRLSTRPLGRVRPDVKIKGPVPGVPVIICFPLGVVPVCQVVPLGLPGGVGVLEPAVVGAFLFGQQIVTAKKILALLLVFAQCQAVQLRKLVIETGEIPLVGLLASLDM